MKRKILLVLLSLVLVFACIGCDKEPAAPVTDENQSKPEQTEPKTTEAEAEQTEQESEFPEYINMDSTLPVVNDGYDVTLSVLTSRSEQSSDSADIWFWKFAKEYMNIDFDVEQVSSEAIAERKNLIFASGDVPDIMLGILDVSSTTDIMKYGVSEGLLLDFSEYMDYMPDLSQALTENPEASVYCTAVDGKMYSVPTINRADMSLGSVQRVYLRKSWLDALKLEQPGTLDDFIDTMYAFKNDDVDGLGAENVIPMAGGFEFMNPTPVILQAMGYVTKISYQTTAEAGAGLNIAVRNGEATFPCNDELFYDYLALCKKLYEDEIISEDFFLIDSTQFAASLAEGVCGFITHPAHVWLTDSADFQQYWAVKPLTSEWNDTPVTLKPNLYGLSGVFVAAATEYPDVCCRYVDMWFGDYNFMMWNGPMDGSDEALGFDGWAIDGNKITYPGYDGSAYTYIITTLQPCATVYGYNCIRNKNLFTYAGIDDYEWTVDTNTETGGGWSNISLLENIQPYVTAGYPAIVYRSEEDNEMLADLKIVIEAYVVDQVAQFITGARSLDEFDQYLKELSDIGMDEYEKYFVDEYEAYLTASK